MLSRAARGVMRRGWGAIDRLKWPSEHDVEVLGQTLHVTAYGQMSYRQYLVSREDEVIEWMLGAEWSTLAYVGASYGLQAIAMSRKGRVLAFEPVSCIFSALMKNVHDNKAHHVTPIQAGVGPKPGFTTIRHAEHHGGTPALGMSLGTTHETISLIGLDDTLIRSCDALLIDIEGFEHSLLCDGPEIPSSVRTVMLELHRGYLTEEQQREVLERMAAQNFTRKTVATRGGQEHIAFSR